MADKGTSARHRGKLPSTTAAPPATGEDGEMKANRRRARPEPGATAYSYSEDDAATVAGCGRSTIRRVIQAGDLKARKLFGRTVILDEDLRAWLRSLPLRAPRPKAAA